MARAVGARVDDRPICRASVGLSATQAEAAKPQRQLRRTKALRKQGLVMAIQKHGKAPRDGDVMVSRKDLGKMRRQDAEEVVGTGRRAEVQEQPRGLQVGNTRDAPEQAVLGLALGWELAPDELIRPQQGAENGGALAVRRQGPVADPNIVVWGSANGGELQGFFARVVPKACLACVELHSRMGPHGFSNRVMQGLHALRQYDAIIDVV